MSGLHFPPMLGVVTTTVKSIGLTGGEWLAVLRIGLGLWWLESWRHKDKKGWFQRGTGIAWAKSVADKHKWPFVKSGFEKVVAPRPKLMAYVVVYAELAIGLGVVVGLLTPIALDRRPAAQRVVLRAHDPRLGRAGAERHDGPHLGRVPVRHGEPVLVARPRVPPVRRVTILAPERDELRRGAIEVLQEHWDDDYGYTVPSPARYGPQWLWDSAFHAVCWDHLGRPDLAWRELASSLSTQHRDGFVPHMRYPRAFDGLDPDGLWGRSDSSTITQPPLFAHAIARLAARASTTAGATAQLGLLAPARRALGFLCTGRPRIDGLVAVVHPWETGCDDSPRFDDWRPAAGDGAWGAAKVALARSVVLNGNGSSVANPGFEIGSIGFNALVAFSLRELAALTGDGGLAEVAAGLVDAIEARHDGDVWVDAVQGTGEGPGAGSGAAPTLDAMLALLVVRDRRQAAAALDQLCDPSGYAGRFGLRYVRADHAAYDPSGYWRGSAWMPMQYLCKMAARRWGRDELAATITSQSAMAAGASRWAEHYDPETGEGCGASPQSWAALAAVIAAG